MHYSKLYYIYLKNFFKINLFFIFILYVFFIIPTITTDTYNIDDKLFYFFQSKLLLLDLSKNFQIKETILQNCSGSKYCIFWVEDMFNAMGNYKITAAYSVLTEKILKIFSIPEIKKIPTVYFFHPLFLHLISFIVILTISVKNKIKDKLYFHFCLILPMLMYFDGRAFNFIISSEIYHSYLPTNYAPRAIISMLLIFVSYLITFYEKESFFKVLLIFTILSFIHAPQNFLILLSFLPYFIYKVYQKNLSKQQIMCLFILYILNFYLINLNVSSTREITNISEIFNTRFLDLLLFSFLCLFLIFIKNYFYFLKTKNYLSKIILLTSLEVIIIGFYVLQEYSLTIYSNELKLVAHSYQQVFDRYLGMVFGAVIFLNLYFIINILNLRKILRNWKIFLIFIILFLVFNYKKTISMPKIIINNFSQTIINFQNFNNELEEYFENQDKYVLEEEFNEKKTFYEFSFLKAGNVFKIMRPDINDPDFWLAFYFYLENKKL